MEEYIKQTMTSLSNKYGISNEYVKAYFALCDNLLCYSKYGLKPAKEDVEKIYNYYVQTIENNK